MIQGMSVITTLSYMHTQAPDTNCPSPFSAPPPLPSPLPPPFPTPPPSSAPPLLSLHLPTPPPLPSFSISSPDRRNLNIMAAVLVNSHTPKSKEETTNLFYTFYNEVVSSVYSSHDATTCNHVTCDQSNALSVTAAIHKGT